MASPGAAPRQRGGAPASLAVFPDEILAEIFLRLDSAADLARASASCTAFRRVARFLRRNRSVFGFFSSQYGYSLPPKPRSFYRAKPPHRSASAARALAQTADFDLSFLPDRDSLRICDACGGRLLLSSRINYSGTRLEDLVVCDPLHRRHVRIPPVPADLTAGRLLFARFPFLAPAGEDEGSSFVVIWIAQGSNLTASASSSATGEWRGVTFHALVFSSATREWRGVIFHGWSEIAPANLFTSCRYYPQKSLCRKSSTFNEVLMLDSRTMEFSVVRLPSVSISLWQSAVVDAGEGRLGLLNIGDGSMDLYSKPWPDTGVDAEDWQHDKTIPLPEGHKYCFSGVGDGYLLLRAIPQDLPDPIGQVQVPGMRYFYFTLNLKTLKIEKLCRLKKCVHSAHIYANFPSPLSLPSV